MINTSITLTATTPAANAQLAAEEHSANFAQMLTHRPAQTKEQNIAVNNDANLVIT